MSKNSGIDKLLLGRPGLWCFCHFGWGGCMSWFRPRWLSGLFGALALGLSAMVWAQPAPGTVYRDQLPLGSGSSVPLPEGVWRVTHVSSLPFPSGTNAWDNVTLKNEQADAKVLFLVVRQSRSSDRWGNTGCQANNPSQFMLSEHGTRSNELINKCTRVFALNNALEWKNVAAWAATTPRSSRDWWLDVSQGLQDMGVNSPNSLLLVEMSVQQFNARALRVEAFVQPPRGVSAIRFRDEFRNGAPRAEHELLANWSAIYIEAMQQGFFLRKPQTLMALAYETGPVKPSPVVANTLSVASRPTDAAASHPQVRELDESSRKEAAERMAQNDKPPALSPSANAGRPAGSVAVAPAPAAVSPATESQQAAVTERARLEQERKAAEEEKRKMAQQLEAMAQMLARLQQENALAAQAAKARETEAAKAREQEAQAAAQASKPLPLMAYRKALVIGNDLYTEVPKLNNAVADAEAMARSLENVGYKVFKHLNVSEKKFRQAIREFKQQISGGDEVLVFYAGHGVQLGNANYLLPVDIHGDGEDQVRDEAILLQKILDDLEDKKAKFSLAVIDACRDNPFKGKGRAIGGRGLAPTTAATGQMIMFSAGSGQQALDRLGDHDKERNGLFTRIFVKEMQKPGLSVDRVLRNVRNEVVRLARTVGHEQTPALYDQSIGEFYFRN